MNTYLTIDQLHDRWNGAVAKQTLAYWRMEKVNQGPAFIKVGKKVLYPIQSVEAYEARNMTAPTEG